MHDHYIYRFHCFNRLPLHNSQLVASQLSRPPLYNNLAFISYSGDRRMLHVSTYSVQLSKIKLYMEGLIFSGQTHRHIMHTLLVHAYGVCCYNKN